MNYGKGVKNRIRVVFLMLTLLCSLGFCTFFSNAADAAYMADTAKEPVKAALNKTSVSITRCRSAQLKLLHAKGGVTWKTSKKSVATVSKTGKVTGVSKGTCKVMAKNKGKTYRCTVTVYNKPKSYLPAVLKKKYAVSKNQGKVVLAGSSSIEYWKSASTSFAPLKVLNMGIASTKVSDWEKLYRSLIVDYDPEAVVLYVGSNDIGDGESGSTGAETAAKTRRLIQKIQEKLPDTKIFYVSICPSRKRNDAWKAIRNCNKKMKAYCESRKNLYYIDVASYFWKNGKPDPTLYRGDRLHLNKKGYSIWNSVIASKVKYRLKK